MHSTAAVAQQSAAIRIHSKDNAPILIVMTNSEKIESFQIQKYKNCKEINKLTDE